MTYDFIIVFHNSYAYRIDENVTIELHSPGARLRAALDAERPLQVVGVVNAFSALLAERAGFRALYLSGAGVANSSFGLPDLGLTSLSDVVTDVERITAATDLPLLVDADTGWEGSDGVGATTSALIKAGAGGMHLEDQVDAKRCGHRPNKVLISADAMAHRIEAAVTARTDPTFVIMARTDAASVEGFDAAVERAAAYVAAGADMIFAEALTDLGEYRSFTSQIPVPVLANITEFGLTPLLSADELAAAGVRLALYPLSGFRAMSAAATRVFDAIRTDGTQAAVVDLMQTRAELYELLDYEAIERELDAQGGAR